MAKDKKKVSKIKTKKKVWYKIIAPKIFGKKEIGESYLTSPDAAVGRVLKINLRELTGNMKDQHAYVRFKITGVDGSTLQTETIGYELVPAFVKRIVRKNTSRIDDYLTFTTKNGDDVVLKTLIVTSKRTQRSTRKELRVKLAEILGKDIGSADYDTLCSNLVGNKIRFGLKKQLAKVYPLREVTIRVMKRVTAPKSEEPVEKPVSEPAEVATA